MGRILKLGSKVLEFPVRSAAGAAATAFVVSWMVIRTMTWRDLAALASLAERLAGINYAVEPVVSSYCDPNVAEALLVGYSVVFAVTMVFCFAAVLGLPAYARLLKLRAAAARSELASFGWLWWHLLRGSVLALFAAALVRHFWMVGGNEDIHERLACEFLRPAYVQLLIICTVGFVTNYFIATVVRDVASINAELQFRRRDC